MARNKNPTSTKFELNPPVEKCDLRLASHTCRVRQELEQYRATSARWEAARVLALDAMALDEPANATESGKT